MGVRIIHGNNGVDQCHKIGSCADGIDGVGVGRSDMVEVGSNRGDEMAGSGETNDADFIF